ncbi:MAG: hypothetical protein AAGA19_16165 [Pseudomonadota bacterium]
MTDPHRTPKGAGGESRLENKVVSLTLVGFSIWFLLFTDYRPLTLAALVVFYFLGYVALRLMNFLDNNRFTPRRYQVGLSWALTGFNEDTDEFDIRPVRLYFLLLSVLSAGLLLRPIVRWVAL